MNRRAKKLKIKAKAFIVIYAIINGYHILPMPAAVLLNLAPQLPKHLEEKKK